jgi:hypothetical protein
MKLAKLLAAGQSFFGGQGVVAYRENKHVYLPKFGSEKNPFAPKPKEAAAPVDVKQVSAPVAAPVAAAPVVAKTQNIFTPPASKPVVAKPARAGWADKLNPFRAPQPVAESPVAAMQPEFSLDAVKVLHNDLSDADVEVVPVKSRSAKPAAPADYLGEPVLRTI